MGETRRWSRYWGRSAGIALAVCMVSACTSNAPEPEQERESGIPDGWFDPGLNTKLLPEGGPTPRMADGHPDLSGRYYPNGLGRMIGSYTPFQDKLDPDATGIYSPGTPTQVEPVFRPETESKYQYPTPYGICAPGGTPTSITTQRTEHGPMELVQRPGVLWILTEFPQAIRRIPTDGSPLPEDPDVSFGGTSAGRWEGDTLVVETIAIDTRMRNISVGRSGDRNAWTHSEQERVIERFSRPSKNFLTYQVTVHDPVGTDGAFRFGTLALVAGAGSRRRLDGYPVRRTKIRRFSKNWTKGTKIPTTRATWGVGPGMGPANHKGIESAVRACERSHI